MPNSMTMVAVFPSASSIPAAVAAYQALSPSGKGKLVGLMIAPTVVPNLPPTETILPGFIEAQIDANQREIAAAGASFAAACDQAGIACEWRTSRVPSAYVSSYAGSLARAADLIVSPNVCGRRRQSASMMSTSSYFRRAGRFWRYR